LAQLRLARQEPHAQTGGKPYAEYRPELEAAIPEGQANDVRPDNAVVWHVRNELARLDRKPDARRGGAQTRRKRRAESQHS
jgi:hypothetical protein